MLFSMKVTIYHMLYIEKVTIYHMLVTIYHMLYIEYISYAIYRALTLIHIYMKSIYVN